MTNVRWIDTSEGETDNENYRSRQVAKEFNVNNRPNPSTAAPLLEALKFALPMLALGI